jgi:hypothetical protein
MGLIPLLLVIVILLLIFRGGVRSGRPLWTRRKPILKGDPIRLILFVILILVVIGLLTRLVLPLGNYGIGPR